MNRYVGIWVLPKDLNRDIKINDLVMIETLEDTLVVEVVKIEDGELWTIDWIIPKGQIVAVKQK